VSVDWRGVYIDRGYRKATLPTYPFQRKRFWVKPSLDNEKSSSKNIATTQIIDWLEQGDTDGFTQYLETSGVFSDAEQTMLPSVAKLLVEYHKRDRFKEQIQEWLYAVEWKQTAESIKDLSGTEKGYWLLLSQSKLGEQLAEVIRAKKQNSITVMHGRSYKNENNSTWCVDPVKVEDFERLLDEVSALSGPPLLGILNFWPAETQFGAELGQEQLAEAQTVGVCSVLQLTKALDRKRIVPKHGIWAVTRRMFRVPGDSKPPEIAHAALSGLGQTIALEHGELWGGIIDLGFEDKPDEVSSLLERVCEDNGETRIAFRNGSQFVPRLVRQAYARAGSLDLDPQASYLITGGTGSLGLHVSRWLADRGARHLVLLARSKPSPEVQTQIGKWRDEGIDVVVHQADVTDRTALADVIDGITAGRYPLRGVIHAAGSLGDAVLRQQDWSRFSEVMKPKLLGGWNLHQLTVDIPLDFFVLFSSAASVFGAAGQGNYAAGNAFLDALAHYRISQGLPSLSINWGPWAEVGMAARMQDENRARMATRGIGEIDVEAGLAILERLLVTNDGDLDKSQIAALPVQWRELGSLFTNVRGFSLLSEIPELEGLPVTSHGKKTEFLRRLMNTPADQRTESILGYLKSLVASTLKMHVGSLSGDSDLVELGIDSLLIMEMLDCIKRDYQLMVYPREVYANPRLGALSEYISREFENSQADGNKKSDNTPSSNSEVQLRITELTDPGAGLPENYSPLPATVFLLSTPRAGSTLARAMLAGHPSLFSPPELHLLPYTSMANRRESLKDSYLEEGLQRALMDLKTADADEIQSLIDGWVDADASITEVYSLLQELAHPRMLIDKSPTYALDPCILERAEMLFTRSKYIHLVRHPVASIDSFVRMRMDRLLAPGASNPYTLAEDIWVTGNRNIDQFLRKLPDDRVYRLRFEDLVSRPQETMEGLSEFLGLDYDPAMVNPYEGKRMLDGVRVTSRPIGDPNFAEHHHVEAEKGDIWKAIQLPRALSRKTMRLAATFDYGMVQTAKKMFSREVDVADVTMSESYIDARGLRFCLCCWGNQEAPLIVLLHGILDQGAAWELIAVRLARAGYRVIAPDLRGHGRSSAVGAGGSYNLMDFLADIEVIVDRLTKESFTLVGHSMGSILAALYAGINPDKIESLVLVETVLPTSSGNESGIDQIKAQLRYLTKLPNRDTFENIRAAASRLRQMTPALSDEFAERLARRITQSCDEGVCWSWDPLLGTRAGISGGLGLDRAGYLKILGQIEVPVTLLYGDSSRFNRPSDLDSLKSVISDANHYILAGGHQLHIEAPQEVASYIMQATDEYVGPENVCSIQSNRECR